MKFQVQELNKPYDGKTRIVNYFAWRPVTIDLETRWLERVNIMQKFKVYEGKPPRKNKLGILVTEDWIDIKFI